MLRKWFGPVLAVVCIGGTMLLSVAAAAAGQTVVFQGGCGLLGASARPDTGSVTVRPGSSVTFVNHLGQPAYLRINGADLRVVPADDQIAVLFQQGRMDVSMLPGCLLGGRGEADSVTVTVTQAVMSTPAQPVVSTPAQPVPSTPAQAVVSTSAPVVVSTPALPSPAGSPAHLPEGPGRPPAARQAAPAPSHVAGTAAPAVVPSQSDGAARSAGPLAGAGSDLDPSMDPVAVGTAVPGPPGGHRPASVLAFVAAICVVGVSIAASRAIIAQRAIRTVAT